MIKYYIIRNKNTGDIAKGTRGFGGGSTFRKGKGGPKLYTLGAAKSIKTTQENWYKNNPWHDHIEIEIVPVTLILEEPLKNT